MSRLSWFRKVWGWARSFIGFVGDLETALGLPAWLKWVRRGLVVLVVPAMTWLAALDLRPWQVGLVFLFVVAAGPRAIGRVWAGIAWLRSRNEGIPATLSEWRAQEQRVRRLSPNVGAMWSRSADGAAHWAPMQDLENGVTRREVLSLEAEAVVAGRMLGGRTSGDHAELLNRWMEAAVSLVGSERGIKFLDAGGEVGGGTVEQVAELSAVACALLASGKRP